MGDLISRIAVVMKTCQEEKLMGHLGVVLYEYLGEEYPEVLGSILGALKAIVNVIGMTKMTPPIKDLLPRLTPILKNRHEKVQENCIDLVGRIADRGPEYVSPRETKSCLYHSGYRNCSRNLFTIHSFARINERIPCSRAQCAKWCIEIALIFV